MSVVKDGGFRWRLGKTQGDEVSKGVLDVSRFENKPRLAGGDEFF